MCWISVSSFGKRRLPVSIMCGGHFMEKVWMVGDSVCLEWDLLGKSIIALWVNFTRKGKWTRQSEIRDISKLLKKFSLQNGLFKEYKMSIAHVHGSTSQYEVHTHTHRYSRSCGNYMPVIWREYSRPRWCLLRSANRNSSGKQKPKPQSPESSSEDGWSLLRSKLSLAVSTETAEAEEELVVKSPMLGLQAIARVPRLHLLLATLQHLRKEAGTEHTNVSVFNSGDSHWRFEFCYITTRCPD